MGWGLVAYAATTGVNVEEVKTLAETMDKFGVALVAMAFLLIVMAGVLFWALGIIGKSIKNMAEKEKQIELLQKVANIEHKCDLCTREVVNIAKDTDSIAKSVLIHTQQNKTMKEEIVRVSNCIMDIFKKKGSELHE